MAFVTQQLELVGLDVPGQLVHDPVVSDCNSLPG